MVLSVDLSLSHSRSVVHGHRRYCYSHVAQEKMMERTKKTDANYENDCRGFGRHVFCFLFFFGYGDMTRYTWYIAKTDVQ